MGVFKKGSDWYIDYYVSGRRRREKVGPNKRLAESVLAKRKVEIAENRFLDVNKKPKVRFDDFAEEYFEFSRTNKRSWRKELARVKHLKAAFGGKPLSEITPLMIEQYKARRRDQVTPATVNRELACLKHMFTKAIEWGRAKENPAKKVKLFREDKQKRLRYLTEEEIERLLEAASPHLRPIIIIALHTGMRKGEILGLKWEDIDFRRGIILVKDTKNAEWREVPIDGTLFDILKELKNSQKGLDNAYVFCHINGEPYQDVKRSFKATLKKAGITNFRFHDLRHTFASYLVMSGVDLRTVQELLGHKTIQMTLRYSHLSPAHKRIAVEMLDGRIHTSRVGMDTNMDTMPRRVGERLT